MSEPVANGPRAFNSNNLAALSKHLPDTSFSKTIVGTLEEATDEADARRLLASLIDKRLEAKRKELDATAPSP